MVQRLYRPMKIVRCYWRTDRTCPHPALCRYGYDCVAKPKGRAMDAPPDPADMDPRELAAWDDAYMALLCHHDALTPAQDAHWRDIHTRLHYAGIPETPGQQAVRCLIARDLRRATA